MTYFYATFSYKEEKVNVTLIFLYSALVTVNAGVMLPVQAVMNGLPEHEQLCMCGGTVYWSHLSSTGVATSCMARVSLSSASDEEYIFEEVLEAMRLSLLLCSRQPGERYGP